MIYIALFISSLFLTYIIKEIAIKKSLVAIPNERSSHSVATPHGGGIAIAITWFIGLTYLYFFQNLDQNLFFALLAGIVLAVVSFLDDIYDLNPKLRMSAQLTVALLGIYFLGGLEKLDFGIFIISNQIITNIIAVVATIWFINLYNFLDGIDGYAGSEAIFLALAGYLLFSGDFYLILIASVAGFLVWNWHKAKIFMGDVNSTLLGYNIAIFTMYQQNEGTSVLVWIVLFGVFWFDATVTLFRRFKEGSKLSEAHRKHAYQRLTQAGWKHDKVVLASVGVNILLFTFVYFISNIIFAFILSIILLFVVMKFIDIKKPF